MPVIDLFFLFILGSSVGSFLNVLIDRLPRAQSIKGRSHCDHCHHKLAWLDLIPVVSFFLLRGKCRYCGEKISWQYPLVEGLTGVMFVAVTVIPSPMNIGRGIPLQPGSTLMGSLVVPQLTGLLGMTIRLGIVSCLIVIFFSDLKYQIIPDSIQIAFFIFGLLLKLAEVFQEGCSGDQLLHCYIVTLFYGWFSGHVADFVSVSGHPRSGNGVWRCEIGF